MKKQKILGTRLFPVAFLALLVGLTLTFTPVGSEPSSSHSTDDNYQGTVSSRLEPHGETLCASGCSLSRHPTPALQRDKFVDLMNAYASQPMSDESPALEELLYYGRQTKSYLSNHKGFKIDAHRLEFLQGELARENVVVEFRIIDETDQVRVGLPPTTVTLDQRYAFEPLNTYDFQPPEASGTVKRVGLNHIWQRI